jgi:putative PIN family toxin of toxin-antitoxin system
MMRVILDTNVFLSGIFWSGPPSVILEAWQQRRLKLVLSQPIFDEYSRVGDLLIKKYKTPIEPFIKLAAMEGEFFRPLPLDAPVSRDPDDDKFIACALSAKCKLIISGDKDLLEVSGHKNLSILKPAEFVRQYL